ncbi:MAG: methyltransferase domain-containing protein [Gammaproteobacteria bacterium]
MSGLVISGREIRVPDYITTALASPRRPADERERDELRKMGPLMAFFDVKPGQQVADLMASRGYVAGVLAEIVGEGGRVYAQNSVQLLARFKGDPPIARRIRDTGVTNLMEIVAELEDPGLPAGQLDAVFSVMFYHDSVWVGTDRARMNAAIFRALKPGGIFAVVDHDALPGAGTSVAKDLHRIERQVVVDEATAAGFTLDAATDLLANPADPKDVLVFDKSIKDHSDRFVLRFRKPG